MRIVFLALLLSLTGIALADDNSASKVIPTSEQDFISKIYGFEKEKIIAQFGQPSKTDNIKNADGNIIASVWQYHNINTDAKGQPYQTTELEFSDDKVIMVTFMNNDGSGTLRP